MMDVHGQCRIKTKPGWAKEHNAQLIQITIADTAIIIKRTHAKKFVETAFITQTHGGCTLVELNVTMALRFQEMAVMILVELREDGNVEEEPLDRQIFAQKSVEISDISMRNFVTMEIMPIMMGAMLIAFSK
jgi:hypothetical protein